MVIACGTKNIYALRNRATTLENYPFAYTRSPTAPAWCDMTRPLGLILFTAQWSLRDRAMTVFSRDLVLLIGLDYFIYTHHRCWFARIILALRGTDVAKTCSSICCSVFTQSWVKCGRDNTQQRLSQREENLRHPSAIHTSSRCTASLRIERSIDLRAYFYKRSKF